MEKERIYLGQRDTTPYMNELAASASRLNDVFVAMGDFIPEPCMNDLYDVMIGGKAIKKQFAESVDEVLAGIKIPALKDEQEKKLKQLSNGLDDLVERAKRYKGNLINFIPDTMIELCDGRVRFSSDAKVLINKHCEIYIETDDQMQVYELSRILADTLNRLMPYVVLYRYDNPLRVVSESDNRWLPDDRIVIDMPARLASIKAREEENRRELEEAQARRQAKDDREWIVNPSIEQLNAALRHDKE